MELGAALPGQSKSTDRHVKKFNKAMKTSKIYGLTDTPKPTGTPSRFVFPQGSSRTSLRKSTKPIHPRCSIFAYGCSNSVHKVIREEDRDMYKQLLQTEELITQHSRRNMLSVVRSMKPFWACGEDCYAWVNGPFSKRIFG